MEEHAVEIVRLLVWILIAVGGAFVSIMVWVAGKLEATLKEKLNSIREELSLTREEVTKTNATLTGIEKDLRKDLAHLDRRVAVIETRCEGRHSEERA